MGFQGVVRVEIDISFLIKKENVAGEEIFTNKEIFTNINKFLIMICFDCHYKFFILLNSGLKIFFCKFFNPGEKILIQRIVYVSCELDRDN